MTTVAKKTAKNLKDSWADKRKNIRLNCAVPVDGKTGSIFDQTATIDFSKGGLGFISRQSIPLNKKIVIELNLSPEEDPLLVVGRVKWVHRHSDSGTYRVGLAFEEMLQGSKSRLNQYFSTKTL